MKTLRLAIPKGSLEEATCRLLNKAGYEVAVSSRSYAPTSSDPELELSLFRPQEMPRYIEQGVIDAGLTGRDWVLENNAQVVELLEMNYSKVSRRPVRWVLAVKEGSGIRRVGQLRGKKIATELVRVTRQYLRRHRVRAQVEFSWGATESKPPKLCDAIVEATETGTSLRANQLRVVDVVMESVPVLVANRSVIKDPWKRGKLEILAMLLDGAMTAERMVGLKMNVSASRLSTVLKILPALKNPTVSPLARKEWFDVDTIIEETRVRALIPALKKAGASGIIEYPLNKVIP